MLPRYTLPEMRKLWSEETKFGTWLNVELAMIRARINPELFGIAQKIEKYAKFDLNRIAELEEIYEHDMIAFVECVQESLKDTEVREWAHEIHKGLTSYDVEDPALILILRQACIYIIEEIDKLGDALRKKASEHKDMLMIARTHGQFAEPDTFGRLLKVFEEAIMRSSIRLTNVLEDELAEAKISGAVGNYAGMDPLLEAKALGFLGLKPARAETQILQRDRHAAFLCALALAASSIGQMAKTFWQMMRSDVGELQEPRKPKQRGSAAMAHKINPIKTEQLFGLSRLVRVYAHVAMEDIESIECREISQSSVERHIFPDATSLVHYMARRATTLVRDLVVFEDKMADNLEQSTFGVWASQRIRNALMDSGVPYSEAYEFIQAACFEAVKTKTPLKRILFGKNVGERKFKDILTNLTVAKCFNAYDYVAAGVAHTFRD